MELALAYLIKNKMPFRDPNIWDRLTYKKKKVTFVIGDTTSSHTRKPQELVSAYLRIQKIRSMPFMIA